ncbi:unnamed protein product [Macrosiphum euphorbiae]|uniref:Replication protein A OB domain-containing protein n=1 Tax=Macrosiphum euphorbiae TaxID=13131 RepID=A0AAV0W389_9HEMI|nr:unnamed protein product [Macrosiphum euphorbiae]
MCHRTFIPNYNFCFYIQPIDENNRKITLNLWNEKVNEFKGKKEDINAIKNAKIGEYNYIKNVSLINSSRVSINPGVPEATKIRE